MLQFLFSMYILSLYISLGFKYKLYIVLRSPMCIYVCKQYIFYIKYPFSLPEELSCKNFKFNFSFVQSNDITAYQNRPTNPQPVPKSLISVTLLQLSPHPHMPS